MGVIGHGDTIAAIATPVGKGGVGVIRISGPLCSKIAKHVLGIVPSTQKACVYDLCGQDGLMLDRGLGIFFKAPKSFTGEDVLEIHAHSNPVVLNMLLDVIYKCGAREAKNGEFSKRAFLNQKLDLTQAEAIADLVNADHEDAAKACARSMQGAFSKQVHVLVKEIMEARVLLEAFIDFPEDTSETPSQEEYAKVLQGMQHCRKLIETIQNSAHEGYKLLNTIHITILGPPNAGKSTLLNALTQKKSAIVHHTPGTTRDVVQASIMMGGISFNLSDTAGLRDVDEVGAVELEGIYKAQENAQKADGVIWVYDTQTQKSLEQLPDGVKPCVIVANKCDLIRKNPVVDSVDGLTRIHLSAQTSDGIDLLQEELKACFGLKPSQKPQTSAVDVFSTRKRHLRLLELCGKSLIAAEKLHLKNTGVELIAEELRLAQNYLDEITGLVSNEVLLDQIFDRFCIGK